MLEIKVNKDSAVVNTDNTNYTDAVADMAIMILAITDYMNDTLRDSGSDTVIPYDKFVLDIAKLVSEYMKSRYTSKDSRR